MSWSLTKPLAHSDNNPSPQPPSFQGPSHRLPPPPSFGGGGGSWNNEKPPMQSYNSAPPFTGYPQPPQGGPPPANVVVVQGGDPNDPQAKKKSKFGKLGSTMGNAAAGGVGFGAGAGTYSLVRNLRNSRTHHITLSHWKWHRQRHLLVPT